MLHLHRVKLQFCSLEFDVLLKFMHIFIGPHQITPGSKPSYNSTLHPLYVLNQATLKINNISNYYIDIHRKLRFYSLGFYVFHEFMHFSVGPHQRPTSTMLNFNQLYIPSNLHFCQFAFYFSSSDNRNLINSTFATFHLGGRGNRHWFVHI